MPIYFFRVKVTSASATELKEVAAPDFLQALQTLATWHPGIRILPPSYQAFSYAISGFTRLWFLTPLPILPDRGSEYRSLAGKCEARG